jgi:hypothetical protein
MRTWITFVCASLLLAPSGAAQSAGLHFPEVVEAGTPFSVQTSGSGEGTLYIVSPGEVLGRKIQLGEKITFSSGDLHSAGHYVAILVAGSSSQSTQFDVVASSRPGKLSFLAKPSRLPVNLSDAISGVVYIFDAFGNLVLQPQQVSFELSDGTRRIQSRTASSLNGVAWVKMNSPDKAGLANFQASVAGIRERRVIQQVPGDPCAIHMTARPAPDDLVILETNPVRDCNGNPVPDGTVVSFIERYAGSQSTVDVPLKRGVARTELPAHKGAVISVAAGVVLGNEIRWTGGL